MAKVLCNGVWDEEYTNREGKTVKSVRCKLGVVHSRGVYTYPYSFQLPESSIRPEVMKEYEVDFTFGYYLKDVEVPDASGEIHTVKQEVPTWRVKSIAVAK